MAATIKWLRMYTAVPDEAASRAIGDTPYYRLTFIGCEPAYSRWGAGHLLLQWGIKQSNESGWPLYLESTVEAAPFYKKYGFTAGETISLPICVGGGTKTQIFTYCGHSDDLKKQGKFQELTSRQSC